MRGLLPGLAVFTLLASSGCDAPASQPSPPTPAPVTAKATFAARRQAHPTKLLRKGPSPQKGTSDGTPPLAREVFYSSGSLKLRAFFALPERKAPPGGYPTVVFFHGGFAFGPGDWEDTLPFRAAGFAVLAPMLRGENGNPGDFELLRGEVDDARAAVLWVAAQPEIDKQKIYAFGHSVGGAVAGLVGLFDDVPLVRTGSCGSVYTRKTLVGWKDQGLVRFDVSDTNECELRLLFENLNELKRPHSAFIGTDEAYFEAGYKAFEAKASASKAPLGLARVPGDHHGALAPAIEAFLKEIPQ
jgi:hypothetical protein